MPNWCYTTMNFHGDKDEIQDFYNKIETWVKTIGPHGESPNYWLGDILKGAGLGHRIDSETDRISCRGYIQFVSELDIPSGSDEGVFTVDVESAWAPCIEVWCEVIKALKYKTIRFSYCAEEPGLELYEIYDPYGEFCCRYIVDGFAGGDDINNAELMRLFEVRYYEDDKQLIEDLQKFVGSDETDLSKLISLADAYKFGNEDSYIRIIKYKLLENLDF